MISAAKDPAATGSKESPPVRPSAALKSVVSAAAAKKVPPAAAKRLSAAAAKVQKQPPKTPLAPTPPHTVVVVSKKANEATKMGQQVVGQKIVNPVPGTSKMVPTATQKSGGANPIFGPKHVLRSMPDIGEKQWLNAVEPAAKKVKVTAGYSNWLDNLNCDEQMPLATSTPKVIVQSVSTVLPSGAIPKFNLDTPNQVQVFSQQKQSFKMPSGITLKPITQANQVLNPAAYTNIVQQQPPPNLSSFTTVSVSSVANGRKFPILQAIPVPQDNRKDRYAPQVVATLEKIPTANMLTVPNMVPAPGQDKARFSIKQEKLSVLLLTRKSIVVDMDGVKMELVEYCGYCNKAIAGKSSVELFCKHVYCRTCFMEIISKPPYSCCVCKTSTLRIVGFSH